MMTKQQIEKILRIMRRLAIAKGISMEGGLDDGLPPMVILDGRVYSIVAALEFLKKAVPR